MTKPDSRPESLSFDSQALTPPEWMNRYRALYGIGADIVPTGPAPRVAFEGWLLDRAVLYDRHLHDLSHGRSEHRVQRDGFSHWTATLVLAGSLLVDTGQGLSQVMPGAVQLIDCSRAMRNESRNARIATLSIAQHRIEEVIGPLDGLHGVVLDPEDCRLYADYVRSLFANLSTVKVQSLPAATSALCTLLKVAIETQGRRYAAEAPSRDTIRVASFRRLVDARLNDRDFNAEAAIAEIGFSRATLYRLLPVKQGLSGFIQARRLEQVRRDLSDPLDQRSFADISAAAGFAAQSHASRAFLGHFGMRPSEYRSAIAASASDADPIAQFRLWQRELQ